MEGEEIQGLGFLHFSYANPVKDNATFGPAIDTANTDNPCTSDKHYLTSKVNGCCSLYHDVNSYYNYSAKIKLFELAICAC